MADVDEAHEHSWRFYGDDPYVVCDCGELRDAISGQVIASGPMSTASAPTPERPALARPVGEPTTVGPADVDEALVEEVAAVMLNAPTCSGWSEHGMGEQAKIDARAVLAHLAATGRLVGEGEERVEWGVRWAALEDVEGGMTQEQACSRALRNLRAVHRTVRTWTAPDGATGTLVGPWVEVEG